MKNLKKIQVYIVWLALVTFVFNACKKDDNRPDNPTNGKTSAVFNPDKTYGSVTDQDGNVYKTITIGTQTWMAENLRTTKYRNGEAIMEVTDNLMWKNFVEAAYCNYKNTKNSDTIATYGRLYNWYAATDSLNIAPTGWHVPSEDEWTILITYLGGTNLAGSKMKETGILHWLAQNIAATNESGFTSIPGGNRSNSGNFNDMHITAGWWSTTDTYTLGKICWLYSETSMAKFETVNKPCGFSIRCVKD